RREIEAMRLTLMSQHPICGLVRTVRDVLGRQVRQSGQDLVDRCPLPRSLGCRLCLALLLLDAPAQQQLGILAPLLGGSDLPRDTVAPGLRLLRSGLGRAPRA